MGQNLFSKEQTQVVKTACELCPWGCGMDVYLEKGKIVKVKGMKEHPLNKGVLCPKGTAAVDYVYSPDRLKYPLKKEGKEWKRISWGEALDLIATKLKEIKENYGARSLAVTIGMPILLGGNSTVSLLRRFCDVYGTPNCFSPESICFRARIIAYILTLGKFPVADPENSRCIIVWGNNPHHSNPPQARRILRGKKKGAKLIVIDPRLTPIAKEADLHLKPRPGSDSALLLGMLNVIISEGLYDKEFVEKWTIGFEQLAKQVEDFSPSKVEKITWISASKIKDLARMYAKNRPSCIIQGTNTLDQQTVGLQNSRAVAILQAITGNMDVPGGFITTSRVHINPLRLPDKLEEKPLGIAEFPLFYEVWGRLFGEGQTMSLPDTILTGKPYPIKGMIVSASNPLLTWPNSKKVESAFKKLDFLVVMDLFMNETAKLADIVLPAASFLERAELCDYYGTLHGIPYVMVRKKIIQVGECWSDLKFWLELGKKVGYQEYFPWAKVEEAIDYALEPTGLSLKSFEEHPSGFPFGEIKYKEYEQKGFRTPSGKVELYSHYLEKLGHSPLPLYKEPLESPLNEALAKEYPLILTTGARQLPYLHSEFRNIPSLKKKTPEAEAEIHPQTAKECGISNGEKMLVETRRGKIEIKARLTEEIIPGVINIPHGWSGANINLLTDDTPADAISGFPILKALLCRVRKV